MTNTVTHSNDLSLSALRRVFRRNRGSIKALADQLGIGHTSVSRFLDGHSTSARIMAAAQKMAAELQKAKRAA